MFEKGTFRPIIKLCKCMKFYEKGRQTDLILNPMSIFGLFSFHSNCDNFLDDSWNNHFTSNVRSSMHRMNTAACCVYLLFEPNVAMAVFAGIARLHLPSEFYKWLNQRKCTSTIWWLHPRSSVTWTHNLYKIVTFY